MPSTAEGGRSARRDGAPFEKIRRPRLNPTGLEVGETVVGEHEEGPAHRSFACGNPEQAAGDAAEPAEILEKLEKLEVRLGSKGPGGLVVNRGLQALTPGGTQSGPGSTKTGSAQGRRQNHRRG